MSSKSVFRSAKTLLFVFYIFIILSLNFSYICAENKNIDVNVIVASNEGEGGIGELNNLQEGFNEDFISKVDNDESELKYSDLNNLYVFNGFNDYKDSNSSELLSYKSDYSLLIVFIGIAIVLLFFIYFIIKILLFGRTPRKAFKKRKGKFIKRNCLFIV